MTLRWGIVTAGKICHDFVNAFNSYPEIGDQAIVAIAARDKKRATEFAKTHNIPKVFDSYEELARSKDIDVAYIGAVNPDHYPLTKLFLENGKHVLCEKPFCLNYKQSETLVNLARKKNLFLMEAVWTRFSPAYVDFENDINAGKLGEIKFVEANFGNVAGPTASRLRELGGGGALLDVGIYLIQLSQYLYKEEPTQVLACGNHNEFGVDASESIILQYSNGRRAVFNAHNKLPLTNKATIYGTKGWITLESPFHFPHRVIDVDGTKKEYEFHTSNLPYNYTNSPGLVYEALETARCIKAGLIESPRMSHKDTLGLAKLMDTIREQLGVRYDADDKEYAA